MSELDVNDRVPNPKFVEHYEFELEVLAVNKTQGVNIFPFYISLFLCTNIFIYYLFLVKRNYENNNRLGWTYVWV